MQSHLFDELPMPPPPAAAPDLGLRDYQQAARVSVAGHLQHARSTLIVLPTGCGKSRTAGAIIWDFKMRSMRSLILTPTIVLCGQMYRDLRALGLRVTMEQSTNRADRTADVVVASVATMRGDRLRSWSPGFFGLVVCDEAHRSTSDMYSEIFAHFSSAKLVGQTATTDRADGVALGNVFETVAYEMSMLAAIRDGWLVPLRFKTAITDFDAKALRTLAGEVTAGSVEAEIARSGAMHEAANTLAELAEGERTVAFLPTVASSKAFVAELLARGVPAEHVDGTTPEDMRNEMFGRFKAGETRVLSNVAVLTEGWDMPEASVIALLNPTKSRSRLTQMIGRGTRLCAGKSSTLVIDFCPGRLKRGRLASPADALAGKMLDDKIHDRLEKEGDLAEAIALAEKTVEDIEANKRASEAAARANARRVEKLAELTKSKAYSFGVQEHDAADILGGKGRGDRGYQQLDVTPQVQAARYLRGLCSPKQANLLAKFGLNSNVPREVASRAIDDLKANGWKVPEHLKADPTLSKAKPANKNMGEQEMADLAGELLRQLKAR